MPISRKQFLENKREVKKKGRLFGLSIAKENAKEILEGEDEDEILSDVLDSYKSKVTNY